MRPGPSDEQLLRMLQEVEDVEDLVVVPEVAVAPQTDALDPCPFCGEPAEYLGTCNVCDMQGCLPPDVWSPGMQDPCLGVCVRCARPLHLACAAEDEMGNPRCPGCAY